jgi:hypothetical protein
MNRWGRVLGCAAVLAAFAALAATAGSATAHTRAHCPTQAQIASLPRWRPGGRLRADVDGDGRPDTVTVRVARWADGRCAFYLAVSTARGVYTRALGPWTIQMSKASVNVPMRRGEWSVTFPKVEEIADLGGRGSVVVLSVGEGAANLGISFFTVSSGRIRFVRVGRALNIWPGGTVMNYETLACFARGAPTPARLRQRGHSQASHPLELLEHHLPTSRFVAVAHQTLYGSNAQMSAAAKRAGVYRRSLRGCALARNTSIDF